MHVCAPRGAGPQDRRQARTRPLLSRSVARVQPRRSASDCLERWRGVGRLDERRETSHPPSAFDDFCGEPFAQYFAPAGAGAFASLLAACCASAVSSLTLCCARVYARGLGCATSDPSWRLRKLDVPFSVFVCGLTLSVLGREPDSLRSNGLGTRHDVSDTR
jgi:hypothetical protein